jgi:hypothetical protein
METQDNMERQIRTDQMEFETTLTASLRKDAKPGQSREDVLRGLKKVVKKQDRPSRPDQEKR